MGWQDDEIIKAPSKLSWQDDEIVDEGFLSKTSKNIIPDIKQTATGLGSMIKEAAFDMPKRALESGIEAAGGVPWAETPSGKKATEFVENAPQMGQEMARPVTHPVQYFQEHPVQQTLNVLGAAAGARGLMGKKPPVVSKSPTIATEEPISTIPMRSTPEPPITPAAPKGGLLPVIEPSSKAGKPHALFAYNDDYGPGFPPESKYQVFGDPNHPYFKENAWGTQKTLPELKEAGIPVVGRTPRSVGQWEPLDLETPTTKTPPTPETPLKTPGNPIQEAKDYVQSAIPKAKEFLNKQYAKQAKDPGWSNTVAQYLQQESQNMAAKEAGAGPAHVGQIGEEGVQAMGQWLMDKNVVSPKVGSIGMKERVNAINEMSGKTIGKFREMADAKRDPMNPIDVLQQIKGQLDSTYEPGMPGAHEYETALKIIEKSEPTHSGVAEVVTKLNKMAQRNNDIKQPHRPFTDVANIASSLNNERIKAVIGPENAAIYEEALKDFGASKKAQSFLKNKAKRSMRHGNAGSLTNRLVQEFMEKAGYRAGARIASGMSKKILASPKTASSLPEMFKEFINQVELLDEDMSGPGMAHGGVVPDMDDSIHHALRKEYDPEYRQWAQGQ